MPALTPDEHRRAALQRRIKFVVEKGAMARLFKKNRNSSVQRELLQRIRPADLAALTDRDAYDRWLTAVIEDNCWSSCSKNGIETDRWAYFAKLINIVVYEVVTNHELFERVDWERLQAFLHVPLDATVSTYLRSLDPNFPRLGKLKGMTKERYLLFQQKIRDLAQLPQQFLNGGLPRGLGAKMTPWLALHFDHSRRQTQAIRKLQSKPLQ